MKSVLNLALSGSMRSQTCRFHKLALEKRKEKYAQMTKIGKLVFTIVFQESFSKVYYCLTKHHSKLTHIFDKVCFSYGLLKQKSQNKSQTFGLTRGSCPKKRLFLNFPFFSICSSNCSYLTECSQIFFN